MIEIKGVKVVFKLGQLLVMSDYQAWKVKSYVIFSGKHFNVISYKW